MKNIPPLSKFSFKAEGGTNSVNRKCNPPRRSCVSSARNAGESAICPVPAQPFAEIVRVECAKSRRECDLSGSGATLCGDRACRGRRTKRLFWRLAASLLRAKRSSWRLAASLLGGVSHEARVLETWRFTFGGSLVRNARFGDWALHFWRKSHTKRSFWRLGTALVELDVGERDHWRYHVICLLLVCGQTVWPKYVRDGTVPLGFARPWWKMRLRGAVPLGSTKHAGVNAACRW